MRMLLSSVGATLALAGAAMRASPVVVIDDTSETPREKQRVDPIRRAGVQFPYPLTRQLRRQQERLERKGRSL